MATDRQIGGPVAMNIYDQVNFRCRVMVAIVWVCNLSPIDLLEFGTMVCEIVCVFAQTFALILASTKTVY